MPGSPALGQRLNLPCRATQGSHKHGRQALGLCCRDPMPTGVPSCPHEYKPVAEAEDILGVLRSKGVVTPGGNCDSPLPFPGVLQLLATQVPAQRLRLWDWGFETPGPGSPGLGSGGGRPEQTLHHHWGAEGECWVQGLETSEMLSVHLQNHPGIADAGGQAGRCSARHLCPHKRSLLPTSQCSCLGPAPLPPPCFSFTNTACCILPMCW